MHSQESKPIKGTKDISTFFGTPFIALSICVRYNRAAQKLRASPKPWSKEEGDSMRFARILAIAVLCLLAFSVVAQAQAGNKPSQFVQLTITTIKPSAINDYEEFTKKVNAARDKTAGSPAQLVYAVNLGGPAFTFYTFTQWDKWADREKFPNAVQMLTKVYGQAEATKLQKMALDAIVQVRSEVYAYNAAASLNAKVFDPPAAFINFQRNELVPELAGAYGTALAKLKNAEEKAGDKRTIIRRNSVQGTGFVSYQVVQFAKLSDRDAQNPNAGDALRQIYGNAEATQVQDILNRAIRNRQQIFLAYRGDLSKPKATASSSN